MKPTPRRCSSTKPDGSACGGWAIADGDQCYAHAHSREWRQANSKGGKANRTPPLSDSEQLAALMALQSGNAEATAALGTPAGIQALLAEALQLTRAGLMDTKVSNALATLANAQKCWVEMVDFARRLDALEAAQRIERVA